MKRIAAYLRVSGDSQDHASQKTTIEKFLAQNNLGPATYYSDTGPRDLPEARPDFQRLMAQLDRYDMIVVAERDRFGAGDLWQFASFVHTLRSHGVELWSVADGCLSDDNAVTQILASVGQVRSKDEQVARAVRNHRGKAAKVKLGEWQGGYIPYGFDVACVGEDNLEKWRVYSISTFERLKIYPDGQQERFDGENNFPPKNLKDRFLLVPTCNQERIDWVKKIFTWFATEAITYRAICTRLNDLGVRPATGQLWYQSRLRPMLSNPLYVLGAQVWNKNAHGRFKELVGGQLRDVPKIKGVVKAGRKRDKSDWIYPEVDSAGIIDREVWEAVQKKLASNRPTAKAPRSPRLFLASLIYCGKCGGRMLGWSNKKDDTYCYSCPTYSRYGRRNDKGCGVHRVHHHVLEEVIDRYLRETGIALSAVLRSTSEEEIEARLEAQNWKVCRDYLRTLSTMWKICRGHYEDQHWTCSTLAAAYRGITENRDNLRAKEAELEVMVDKFLSLTTPLAQKAANEKMARLEAEILALREQVQPLDEKLLNLRSNLEKLEGNIAKALDSNRNQEYRQKGEALARVIARVVCHFTYRTCGSQERSILDRVDIEPIIGETVRKEGDLTFLGGILPAKDCVQDILTRSYSFTDRPPRLQSSI